MGTAEQTLIVLAVMAVLFVTEIIPLAITSLGGAITLGLMGIITPKVVFSGLSDSTVVLFAGMFVVGAALFYTGLAQKIGETVVSHAGTSENGLMLCHHGCYSNYVRILVQHWYNSCITSSSCRYLCCCEDSCVSSIDAFSICCRYWWYHYNGWYTSKYYRKWYIN